MSAAAGGGHVAKPNRLTPYRFVLAFGVVSMLGDFVYEGGRSIVGPYLATLGASATLVGIVTGAGEAVALVLRLWTGPASDRTGRHWALAIVGYGITMVSVPFLAVAQAVAPASFLVVSERFGKAVRSPARDTMLAQASVEMGRGRAFAIHEAMDQSGALVGPLLVALMVAISGYRLGFAVLAVPGVLAMVAVLRLRRAVPHPSAYEHGAPAPSKTMSVGGHFPARFWLYSAFTALTMTGFATFAVLAYHLQVQHVLSAPLIPVAYAAAMGAAALGALGAGLVYDRVGLRGMVVLPALGAVVPFLSFSTTPILVWVGAVVWGVAMGIHESTMRAAVADLVPAARRGAGYGTFTAIYGLAWLAGAAAIAALYSHSVGSAETFVVVVQVIALGAFVPLWRR
ncbi:MAG TPA: MFS transporter [Gaiellales bacterium]|nr:MFS transporter [Gaiellales bacterium]